MKKAVNLLGEIPIFLASPSILTQHFALHSRCTVPEARGDVLVYSSAPLTKALQIVGPVHLQLEAGNGLDMVTWIIQKGFYLKYNMDCVYIQIHIYYIYMDYCYSYNSYS